MDHLNDSPVRDSDASELAELRTRLDRARAEAEAFFQGTPVMTALLDRDRTIRRANQALLSFLKLPAHRIQGRRFGEVFRCIELQNEAETCGSTDGCQVCELRSTILDTLHDRAPIHGRDVVLTVDSHGRSVQSHLVVTSTPVSIDDCPMIMLCLQDITRRSRLEREIDKSRRMQSLGTLAGSVAHDLNNVLTVVLGNLSLARLQTEPGDEIRELLERCEAEIGRAADLSDRLLTFAQGGAPRKGPLDLRSIVDEAIDQSLRNVTTDYRIQMTDQLPVLMADGDQLTLALRHLITNASQAMDGAGTVDVIVDTVTLKTGELPSLSTGRYIRLRIRDNGPGIAEDELDRVVDPFYSTREGSTGLGLTVAYSIASRHDGRLTLSSDRGWGTTVDLLLPASADDHAPPVASADAVPEVSQPDDTRRKRLLIMDDEDSLLESTSAMLSFVGWDVTTARDGHEMLEAYRAATNSGTPFDVVILDLTVPQGMGGREAIRQLVEFDPTVRAIVSSGYAQDPIMAEFWEYGFTDVLPKPYGMRELEDVVSRVATGLPSPHQVTSS